MTPFITLVLVAFGAFMAALIYGQISTVLARKDDKRVKRG